MNKRKITIAYELLKYFLVNKYSSIDSISKNVPLTKQEIQKGLELLRENEFVFLQAEGDYYLNHKVTYVVSQMIRAHEEFYGKNAI